MEYNHLKYVKKYFELNYITYCNIFSKKEINNLIFKVSEEVRNKYNNIKLVLSGGADEFISNIVKEYMNNNHQNNETNYTNLKNYVTKYINAIIIYNDKTLNVIVDSICSMLMSTYNYDKMMNGNMDKEIDVCYKLSLESLSEVVYEYVVEYVSKNIIPLTDINEVKIAQDVVKLIMTNNDINVVDLFFGRYDKLIDKMANVNRKKNSAERQAEVPNTIEYIDSRIFYKTQNLELLGQIINKIDIILRDRGLTPKEIVSGEYDVDIRELYYEYYTDSVDYSIKDNSIKKEGFPNKFKVNNKKVNLPQTVSSLLTVSVLVGLLSVGGKEIGNNIQRNIVNKNLLEIDGYGYHQVDTIHDHDFIPTVENIMKTYDEYSKFDNPNFSFLSFYRAYNSVTKNKMYVMENMFDQIKIKIRNNNGYYDLQNVLKTNGCYLEFIYDRLEDMGYEEIRDKKYFDLLVDYVNIRNKHPYSNPVDYLTDSQKRLLNKVCKMYEELSQQYLIELGLFLDNPEYFSEYSNTGGRHA